jgi:nitroreductase
MEFAEVLKTRHSIRSFKEHPLEEKKLIAILEAANSAPSAGNLQAYEIYVITDSELRQKLVHAAWGQHFISQAPVVLVFCAHPSRSSVKYGRRGTELYCIQDATCAASFAHLAATSQRIASCWVGAFDEEEVRKCLELPSTERPIIIMPMGYAHERGFHTSRRSLEDIVHYK